MNECLNPLDNFKFFIYEIDYKFSVEKVIDERNKQMGISNCNWNTNTCQEMKWEGHYSTMRQYGADVTIIELYKSHCNRVLDPTKADFFVVPYPHSSILRNPVRQIWCQADKSEFPCEIEDLISDLKYYNPETKDRHLWILTGDENNHVSLLENQPLRTTLGPNNYRENIKPIIIPPSILEPRFQPSQLIEENWDRERKISIVMITGLINNIRKRIYNILEEHKEIGGLKVETHIIENHRKFPIPPQEVWEKYRDSVFGIILTGDLPYQKRFFDVCLSGCIPVVISYPSSDPNKNSWFRNNGPPFDNCYPWSDIINYKEFVLEFDDVTKLVPELNKLMNDKDKLRRMRSSLKEASIKFVMGLEKDKYKYKDAFYYLNVSIKKYLENM